MALINHRSREVHFKIVYYGPGLCGKTTNLRILHEKLPAERRGRLISIATDHERTLFFDFLPIDLGQVNGFSTRFHLYTVPGQVYYKLSRKAVLQGVDGIVFVADSHPAREYANRDSLADLLEHLRALGIGTGQSGRIPWVFQWNKRDVGNPIPVERLRAALNVFGAPEFESVASAGKGVSETLRAACKAVLARLVASGEGTADGRTPAFAPPVAVQPPARVAPPVAARARGGSARTPALRGARGASLRAPHGTPHGGPRCRSRTCAPRAYPTALSARAGTHRAAPRQATRHVRTVARWLAMLGPAGLSPIAPATAGSALIAAIGWFLPVPTLPVFLLLLAIGTAIAVWAAGEAEHTLGHDAKPICIDEAVGQTLALFAVPHHLLAFALSFVLFRICDVWKPLGAQRAQELPGGLGVVADDVIAGLVACGAFHALWWAARRAGISPF